MITPEIRQELRIIQSEFKKPLPVKLHEVRELPGGKKWVFLPWQVIRDRLDEVYPEWIPDYSEIQYMGNDAICRCGISILGVRKEAIASVPISILSSNGREMARGSASDRLAAEAIKNAAETWGIGRYLDDQEFTIRYLWENKHHLSDEMNAELQRLVQQYKINTGAVRTKPQLKDEGGLLHAMSGVSPAVATITKSQGSRLWAIAKKELGLTDSDLRSILAGFGVEKTLEIPLSKYDAVIESMKNYATKF